MTTAATITQSLLLAPEPLRLGAMPKRLALLALVVAAADFLFVDPASTGLPFFLFALALAVTLTASKSIGGMARHKRIGQSLAIGVAAALPLFENVSLLSVAVSAMGLVLAALWSSPFLARGATKGATAFAFLLMAMTWRLPADLLRYRTARHRHGRRLVAVASILVWTMPLALTFLFLILFAQANPLIESLLAKIDFRALLAWLDPVRMFFWLFMGFVTWPLLKPHVPAFLKRREAAPSPAASVTVPLQAHVAIVFGPGAVLRALVLFNMLFAVQTVLDALYLWGGLALPHGMTYAEYAHRGAYPLIVTALLAAAFVLIAIRPGATDAGSRTIRLLVYAFVAQNILLVISSILRLDLYVGFYALTYLRVAAFIWMALVAAGLAFIVARIALGKSGSWLVGANLATASAVLYACCFVNFAAIIGNFNVAHAREFGGQGIPLDASYLASLGPQALPGMAEAVRRRPDLRFPIHGNHLADYIGNNKERLARDIARWRSWTFRDWRLARQINGKGLLNESDGIIAPQSVRPDAAATTQTRGPR